MYVGNEMDRIKELILQLNYYRNLYYNKNISEISDEQYDILFDELKELEDKTGIIMSNSPTQSVGYVVQTKFKKVKHSHPMLSLAKYKTVEDIVDFIKKGDTDVSLKMDGLSLSLTYKNGVLVGAETRGDGQTGEFVLENAKMISNIPLKINPPIDLVVDGEIIVDLKTFERKNENGEFSHPRNYAAGAIRQLDTSITKDRELKFIAWRCISGLDNINSWFSRMKNVESLGFDIVPCEFVNKFEANKYPELINQIVEDMFERAEYLHYPIDGLVCTYDDIAFGESLGNTSHHPNHSMSYKRPAKAVKTVLRDIVWNTSRNGVLSPVAIFDEVDLSGAITSKATLHNLDYIRTLELGIGDEIEVIRSNEVIPRVANNLTRSNTYVPPAVCPSCGSQVKIKTSDEGDTKSTIIVCENPNCPAKNLARFVQFVSKQGMNIEGLSEATLEKFIDEGYIKTFEDIYKLDRYKKEIIEMDGFGQKSWNKLWESIQWSRNCKLENYLVALGIPLIGKTAAKTISKYFKGKYESLIYACCSGFDFTQLEDFGEKMNKSIHDWAKDECRVANLEGVDLIEYLRFEEITEQELQIDESNFCNGKTFVVTGKFSKPRSFYEELITSKGGKLAGSVSKKTDFLLTNDGDSGSSKSIKAKELGIPIMSEEEFMTKVNG